MTPQDILRAVKRLQLDYNALIIKVDNLETQLKQRIPDENVKKRVGRPRKESGK